MLVALKGSNPPFLYFFFFLFPLLYVFYYSYSLFFIFSTFCYSLAFSSGVISYLLIFAFTHLSPFFCYFVFCLPVSFLPSLSFFHFVSIFFSFFYSSLIYSSILSFLSFFLSFFGSSFGSVFLFNSYFLISPIPLCLPQPPFPDCLPIFYYLQVQSVV